MGVNDDLLGPLESETFASQGALATGHFTPDGDFADLSAQLAQVSVVYDADTGSYRISGGGITQRFLSSHLVSDDGAVRTFQRAAGAVTDTLYLTNPGTAGPLTYRYVGAGTWLHMVEEAGLDGSQAVAFIYGAPAPASTLPISGTATYEVDLLGLSDYYTHQGQGLLAIDFAGGGLSIEIDALATATDGVSEDRVGHFVGQGALSGGADFQGDFTYYLGNTGFSAEIRGGFTGGFYGPNREEVGAVFAGNSCCGAFAGTILGRQGGVYAHNLSLFGLNVYQQFYSFYRAGEFREILSTGESTGNLGFGGGSAAAYFSYLAATDSFNFRTPSYDQTFSRTSEMPSADGRFLTYDNGTDSFLYIYRPGPDNPEIKLTYASFGWLENVVESIAEDRREAERVYFYWGLPTLVLPLSGSASYSGIVVGTGAGTVENYEVDGTIAFTTNFSSLTGTLNLTGTSRFDGDHVEFGEFDFDAHASLSPDFGNEFSGWINFETLNGVGALQGRFFGYNATEFAGSFGGISMEDPDNPGADVKIFGAFAGTRD